MTLTEDQRGQVEANMGLIGKVLKDKLRGSSALGVYTHEDLFQIGCVGLCKAVAEDKKTGCFSTFAYRLIWNEICDALVLGNRYAMHEAPTEDLSDTHPRASEFASSNSRLELEELQRRLSRDAPAGIRKGMQVLILKAHGYTSKFSCSCRPMPCARLLPVHARISESSRNTRPMLKEATFEIRGSASGSPSDAGDLCHRLQVCFLLGVCPQFIHGAHAQARQHHLRLLPF